MSDGQADTGTLRVEAERKKPMEDLRSSKRKKTADPAVAQRVEKLLENTQLSKDTAEIIIQIAFGSRVDADVA